MKKNPRSDLVWFLKNILSVQWFRLLFYEKRPNDGETDMKSIQGIPLYLNDRSRVRQISLGHDLTTTRIDYIS